jgi:hypothetical protein
MANAKIAFEGERPMGVNGAIERAAVDVSTDANGDGSETVFFNGTFDSSGYQVFLFAPNSDENLTVTSINSGNCEISVNGSSTTNGTVRVNVLAVGARF